MKGPALFQWNPDRATQFAISPSHHGVWVDEAGDAIERWQLRDGTTVRGDGAMTIVRLYDGDEAMFYRTIVIASSHHCYRAIA